jgi:hypothetical protein
MKIFLLLTAFFGGNLYAKDVSHFMINAASFDQPFTDRHTKVHFIVTDSQGRKTGFKSFFTTDRGTLLVNEYREIPNSSYGVDQIGSLDPGVIPDEPESATLDFFSPVLKDTYTIQFVGIGDCKYFADVHITDQLGETHSLLNSGYYIRTGTTQQYSAYLDPTPGAPAPVITKIVTFDTLKQDLTVARKLNQLGDDKFVGSLTKMVDLAERLSGKCYKRGKHEKGCAPAVAVLKMFIKRLETANRKCDSKKPQACDEDKDWDDFGKEHRKDHDYDDFFREWDRDDWHKHRKTCKRFVSDEALKIIKEDAQWLIKSLGGEIDKGHDDRHEHDGKGR